MTDSLPVEILEQSDLTRICMLILSIYLPPSVNDSHLRNNSSVTMNTCVSLATAISKNQIIYGRGNSAIWFIQPGRCSVHQNKLYFSPFYIN